MGGKKSGGGAVSEAPLSAMMDAVGGAIVELRSGFEAEVSVAGSHHVKSSGKKAEATVSLEGAFRALRRGGVATTEALAARWCRLHECRADGTTFTFGQFVRLYYELTRTLRWARPVLSDSGGVGAAATNPLARELARPLGGHGCDPRWWWWSSSSSSSGQRQQQARGGGGAAGENPRSLLRAVLRVPVHDKDGEEKDDPVVVKTWDAASSSYKGSETGDRALSASEAPRRSVRAAFLRYDLYGDAETPGEMSWADVPAALGSLGLTVDEAQVAKHARRRDIAAHYPADFKTFKAFYDHFNDGATRKTVGQTLDFCLDESTRRAEAADKFNQRADHRRAHDRPPDCAPVMPPDLIQIRREALKRRQNQADKRRHPPRSS